MSSRKKTMTEILLIEQQLNRYQTQAHMHQRWLLNWVEEHTTMLITALAAFFIIGWKVGKLPNMMRMAKKVLKIAPYIPQLSFLTLK